MGNGFISASGVAIMDRQWTGSIQYDGCTDGWNCVVTGPHETDLKKRVLLKLEKTEFERFQYVADASTFKFSRHDIDDNNCFLQTIVDLAWEIGVRPLKSKADERETNALRYHLEDMRALAGVTEKRGK